MFARVQIEHEVCQRPLQFRSQIPINCKACARELHRAFQVENAKFSAEIPMRLGCEVKLRRRSAAADFYVFIGTMADWNALVRNIGNARKNILQPRIEIGSNRLSRLDL